MEDGRKTCFFTRFLQPFGEFSSHCVSLLKRVGVIAHSARNIPGVQLLMTIVNYLIYMLPATRHWQRFSFPRPPGPPPPILSVFGNEPEEYRQWRCAKPYTYPFDRATHQPVGGGCKSRPPGSLGKAVARLRSVRRAGRQGGTGRGRAAAGGQLYMQHTFFAELTHSFLGPRQAKHIHVIFLSANAFLSPD